MQRRHEMPFGADYRADREATRFRLWAPQAMRVELGIEHGDAEHWYEMEGAGEGWFELTRDDAPPGTRYRYRADGGLPVPDPASRMQAEDVHGHSVVTDPTAFRWEDRDWRGRPWEEAVFYELHTGSFTEDGTFEAVIERLDHLRELGVTAVELMPVNDFPGRHDWGYDGVLPFAPDRSYGTPEDLKRLVQAAHARGLMVFLDVVYNHFGPEGNYLHLYAPQFFTERHHTPWGAAINFDGEHSRWVRRFFIDNALYWLSEFHFDGLRLDAVHAIIDDSRPDILEELAEAVRRGPGAKRQVHLVLENDRNQAHYLDPTLRQGGFRAQWNDDIHHALHTLATGESGGYYEDYAARPAEHLGRCLAEGFAYQGDPSPHRGGRPRGEPSRGLPPTAFVNFLQNHDQVGNRAFGERIALLADEDAIAAATAVLLLSPAPPLLFMGQEWNSRRPFPFFADFGDDLKQAVTDGRRREFASFPEFQDPAALERIPDPLSEETFRSACLDWAALDGADGGRWLALHRELLQLRREKLVPLLASPPGGSGEYRVLGPGAVHVRWTLAAGARLTLQANLAPEPVSAELPGGEPLYRLPESAGGGAVLPPWSVLWYLDTSPQE